MKPALHSRSPPLLGITGNSAFRTENAFNVLDDNLLGRLSRVPERPELQRLPACTGTAVTRPQAAMAVRS
jgi:hypothetical protein